MSTWKTLDEFKHELLSDPSFRERFESRDLEFVVAREILAARRAAGMSQATLAKATGASQSRISRWERGIDVPRLDALRRIAEATGTHLRLVLEPAGSRS